MGQSKHIYIWKRAPFVRLLMPIVAGIVFQFYLNLPISLIATIASVLLLLSVSFSFFSEAFRFRFRPMNGIFIALFLTSFGACLTWQKDMRNHQNWYGKFTNSGSYIVATINEPTVEKAKSIKAVALAESVINKGIRINTAGRFLIYFNKDSASRNLKYGDKIILQKPLNDIKGTGNPGAFDYAQYCSFHQLFHQVYLKKNDWIILKEKNKSLVSQFIFSVRENTVSILEKYLGNNNESAIAKAILIGYKVDLDKDLVQAYSNAGVVHLIAISGLHMGIIYGVLIWLFSSLPFIKKSKPLKLMLILSGLWIFAVLTGASPSVLRAAVMFSFIVTGKAFNKNSSIYNSLAASAFLLLCFNPFILFDVGFQLSYLAVLGIVVAQKSISNWLYFKNKWLQRTWQIAAVSLSAQLFTFPLCFYYFHQLPLLFLFSNMIAIPLATLSLCGCMLLIMISPVSMFAFYFGKIIYGIIWLLNITVLFFDSIPYASWQGVSITLSETILLFGIISSLLVALMKKNKSAFRITVLLCLVFTVSKSLDSWQTFSQKKMIVYNIPSFKAIEFVDKNNFYFAGDSSVLTDALLNNFNLKPSHIAFRLDQISTLNRSLFVNKNFYRFYHLKILMIDSAINYSLRKKINMDHIIISKNASLKISSLAKNFDCNNYIFDASNSLWKIQQWKKECEELHLHFHFVSEQGAYVTDL